MKLSVTNEVTLVLTDTNGTTLVLTDTNTIANVSFKLFCCTNMFLSFDNYCHKLKNILVYFIAEYLLYHEDIYKMEVTNLIFHFIVK